MVISTEHCTFQSKLCEQEEEREKSVHKELTVKNERLTFVLG